MVSAYLSYFIANNDQPCHMEYNAMYVNDILAITYRYQGSDRNSKFVKMAGS